MDKVKKTYSVAMFVRFHSNDTVENQLFYLSRKNCIHRFGYLSTFPIGLKTWHWGSANVCLDEDPVAYETDWGSPRSGTELDPAGLETFRWYQTVYVLDDNHIKLYVDGVLLGSIESPYGSSIENYTDFIFTLGDSPEGHQHMDGEIDDVRVYNRALTDADVKALYSAKDINDAPSNLSNLNLTDANYLALNIPDIIMEDMAHNIRRLSATLTYAGQDTDGSGIWTLKDYQFFKNTLPVANNRDSARLLSNYDVSIPFADVTAQGKSVVYWGSLKYIGDYKEKFNWKIVGYGESTLGTCSFSNKDANQLAALLVANPNCKQLWDAWSYFKLGNVLLQNEFAILYAQFSGVLTKEYYIAQNNKTAQVLVDAISRGGAGEQEAIIKAQFISVVADNISRYISTEKAYTDATAIVNNSLIKAVMSSSAGKLDPLAVIDITPETMRVINQYLANYSVAELNSKINTLSIAMNYLADFYKNGGDSNKVAAEYVCDPLIIALCKPVSAYQAVFNKIVLDLKRKGEWYGLDGYSESNAIAIIEQYKNKVIPDISRIVFKYFK
ncbi:MAG: LamG domain-containing protein [Methylococcaceae bacterium]